MAYSFMYFEINSELYNQWFNSFVINLSLKMYEVYLTATFNEIKKQQKSTFKITTFKSTHPPTRVGCWAGGGACSVWRVIHAAGPGPAATTPRPSQLP